MLATLLVVLLLFNDAVQCVGGISRVGMLLADYCWKNCAVMTVMKKSGVIFIFLLNG